MIAREAGAYVSVLECLQNWRSDCAKGSRNLEGSGSLCICVGEYNDVVCGKHQIKNIGAEKKLSAPVRWSISYVGAGTLSLQSRCWAHRHRNSLPVPIIFCPLGTSPQIRRNNKPSFLTVHSSLGIALRLRIAGLCGCRRQVLPQFPPEIRQPLCVPAEADSQDDLRLPFSKSAFFFMVSPPCKIFNGILLVIILKEVLPKQHGTCVGLKKAEHCHWIVSA